MRWPACLALLSLALGGCRDREAREAREARAPAPYELRFLAVEPRDEQSQRELEALPPGWARAELDNALKDTKAFSPASAGYGRELDTAVALRRLKSGSGSPVLRLELVVEPPPDHEAALGRDWNAIVEVERVDGSLVLERDFPLAASRAMSVLEAKLILVRGDDGAIERLLGEEDSELVLLAIDWVGTHRLREHGDGVAALLDHREDKVRLRAIECLGIVGAPRHAAQLVRAVPPATDAQAGRLYEALAALGGPDAEGFLEFAARNEDNPALAKVAQHALDEVKASEVAPPASPPPPTPTQPRGHR